MEDQLSPDISRVVANQSTIQLQLLLALIGLQPMQRRQLGRTGGPVVTNHQPGELGVHLQATQTTPAQGSPVTGTVLTTAAVRPGAQYHQPEVQ